MKTVVENITKNNLKLCSVESCNLKHLAQGFCSKHYTRLVRHGDPLKGGDFRKKYPKILTKICLVKDCNSSTHSRGYCIKHYYRLLRNGDPLKFKQPITVCKIEGCNGKHKGLGFCEMHYDRFKYGTPLNQEKRVIDKTRGCAVLNCDRPHWGKYYCKIHYMKFLSFRQSRRKDDPKLEFIMNLVRRRDNNTCQWQNCHKTIKETSIHVHHIFPQSEYPELIYFEKYMICYCKKHHKEWHTKRGDKYYVFP